MKAEISILYLGDFVFYYVVNNSSNKRYNIILHGGNGKHLQEITFNLNFRSNFRVTDFSTSKFHMGKNYSGETALINNANIAGV